MKFVNIRDAKTNLSKYLAQVTTSHDVIVICKNGKPIAQLVGYKPLNKRLPGSLKGKIKISPDFDELSDDFISHFK
jgi:prevent-host-death family protein